MQMGLLLFLVISLALPGPTVNGVKIVTRQMTAGMADTRIDYVTADRLRSEWQSVPDRPGSTMANIILGGERQKVFVLDLQAHEFVTYETDARGLALGVRPKPTGDSGGTLQIWLDYVDTGERKEIFGHLARHIITREKRIASPGACSGSSESQTDGWYVDTAVVPQWRPLKKGVGGVVVASAVSNNANGNCLNKVDKIDVHRVGDEPGFPLKASTTLQSEIKERGAPKMLVSTWGSEVVEFRSGPLDASLFEVPPDFRQVERLRAYSPAPAPLPRQQTGWEWFKEKLSDMFR
jgi:hypothetical protein